MAQAVVIEGRPVHPAWDWAKQAITIIAAAGSAYMGIRLDIARTAADIAYIQQTQARHEAAIERIREKLAGKI